MCGSFVKKSWACGSFCSSVSVVVYILNGTQMWFIVHGMMQLEKIGLFQATQTWAGERVHVNSMFLSVEKKHSTKAHRECKQHVRSPLQKRRKKVNGLLPLHLKIHIIERQSCERSKTIGFQQSHPEVWNSTKMAWKVLYTDQQSTCHNTWVTLWGAQCWVVQLRVILQEDSHEVPPSFLQNVENCF